MFHMSFLKDEQRMLKCLKGCSNLLDDVFERWSFLKKSSRSTGVYIGF